MSIHVPKAVAHGGNKAVRAALFMVMDRAKLFRFLLVAVVAVAAAAALGACSLKKNTAASRRYTEFITRYNIYFNGDEHYKETVKKMEDDYQDDFTRLLLVHPADMKWRTAILKPEIIQKRWSNIGFFVSKSVKS